MKHLLLALFACVMAVGQTVPTPLPGDPLRIPPQGSITPAAVTGARICTISSSSATAYVGATSPAMSAYPTGVEVRFTANQTSGAAPTLNCGGGALAIRDALASAAIPTGFMESGYVYTVRSNGTYWLMQEPAPGASGQKFLTNVGIGTTGPTSKLDVRGTVAIQPGSANVKNITFFDASYGLGMDSSNLVLWADQNQGISFKSDTTGNGYDGTSLMVIKSNGNVGIGTTGPATKLEVASGSSGEMIRTSLGIQSAGLGLSASDIYGTGIYSNGTLQAVFNSSGGLSLGSYAETTHPPTGGMIISGNVGIATAFPTGAPAQKLTTVGSIFAYDMSTLGAEKATSDATCTGWTLGAGWACASGVITHTAGNTATATYTASVIAGNVYRLTLTSTGRTAGSVTPSLGGVAGAANSVATLATYDIATTGTGALTLTPTTDFDGAITVNGAGQISVKPGLASTISAKSISHRPIVFADLGTVPSPKNGDQLYCGDCTYGARGDAASGSGTGAFLGYVNGAWKNM